MLSVAPNDRVASVKFPNRRNRVSLPKVAQMVFATLLTVKSNLCLFVLLRIDDWQSWAHIQAPIGRALHQSLLKP